MTKLIIVRGSIGVGKSSALSALAKKGRWVVMQEPVDEWKEDLRQFYEAGRLYPLQKRCVEYVERQLETLRALSARNVDALIVERSANDILDVFLPLNRKHLSRTQYRLLHARAAKVKHALEKEFCVHEVFLRASLATALCRITERADGYIDNMDKFTRYLNALNKRYEKLATPCFIHTDYMSRDAVAMHLSTRIEMFLK